MKQLTRLIFAAAVLLTVPALHAANVISTLGNTNNGFSSIPNQFPLFARAFTTGGTPVRLQSITVQLQNTVSSNNVRVQLWTSSNTSDRPVTLVEDLGSIPVVDGAFSNHTVTSTLEPMLTAGTRYWVSVSSGAGSFGTFSWGNSTSSASNSSDIGSTLVDARASSSDGGANWNPEPGTRTQLFSVTCYNPDIVVTTAADDNNGATNGTSLREALTAAASASGSDRIIFDSALDGKTLALTTSANGSAFDIPVGNDVTIDASALSAGVKLDAGTQNFRFFQVNTGASLTLRGLTLANGGGANCLFGGAIYNTNGGTLTLTRCTFSGNRADDSLNRGNGGAIFNYGTATLTHCTLFGNSADDYGGAICSTNTGTLTLTHCTLSGNKITRSYGGGIYNQGLATLTNTIIADNTALSGFGPDIGNFGTLTARSCLLSNGTSSTLTNGVNGNIIGVSAQLASLGSYGGPTQTMPPLPGSPAIDAVNVVAGLAKDQRGVVRGTALSSHDFSSGTGGVTALGTGSVTGGSFRLTQEVGSQTGSFVLPDLGAFNSFTASFDYQFTAGNVAGGPADGMSFCFGPQPTVAFGEAGPPNSHVIRFTIYSLVSDFGFISYYKNGVLTGSSGSLKRSGTSPDSGSFRAVTATLAADGQLTVTYKGATVITAATGYTYAAGHRFSFGGRTGGNNSEQRIDNLGVLTNPTGVADIGAVEALSGPVNAVVTSNANSGPGTLRDTLAAVPAGSTLTFAPALSGQTITLTSEISVTKTVTVDASALSSGITLRGGGTNRIFAVSSGLTVLLRALTLTGGNANNDFGGAIYNYLSTLTLERCTLFANTAGGGNASGGGAIYSDTASITGPITSSTTLTHCTLVGNTATVSGRGGAIYNINGRTTLTHCTISGNTAPAGEGSGVASYGDNATETVVSHSIIAGNTGSDVDFVGNTINNSFASSGHNLIGSGGAATSLPAKFNKPGDQINTTPQLASLGKYGGPTQTMPPMAGSPAIDATSETTVTDQRGFTAQDGDANGSVLADIGAAESQVLLVTTATDEDNGNTLPANGTGTSLREAIADTSGHADIIRFSPAVFNGQPADIIRLTLGTVIKITRGLSVDARDLTSAVTISGDANGNSTPDSGDTGIFEVDLSGANGANYDHIISLHRLIIKDAYSTNAGGGILSRGTVTVNQCLISGNHAANNAGGGGIFNDGTLTVNQSTITGNHADLVGLGGGGIYNGRTLTINQSTITGNHADNTGGVAGGTGGGGIANDGILMVNQSTITGNHADNALGGGGIHSRGTDDIIVLTNSLVAGNSITTGTGSDILNSGIPITSSGRTLIGKSDGSSTTWNTTDLTGTITSPLDALVAPVASNGGLTPTVALLPGSPAVNARLIPSEVQRIIVYNAIPGSTFTITFNGRTTAPVVFKSSPADIQSALEALSTVGTGNVIVTGHVPFDSAPSNYVVSFRGALAAADQPALTAQMAVGSLGAVTAFVYTLVDGGSTAVTTDQRGFPIVGTADLGAYESQGSTVALTSSDNPAVFGTSVTFTATVNELDPDVITPTGTVTFRADGNALGSPVTLNGSGIATLTTSALTGGSRAITATYNGDARLLASTSSPLSQTVFDLSVGSGSDSGNGSLRQALINAAANPGPDTITLPPGLNGMTLTLLTQLLINDTDGVTIDATGLPSGFRITNPNNAIHPLINLATNSILTVKGVKFDDGDNAAIHSTGTLTLSQCTFSRRHFGAINNNGGTLTLTQCTLFDNSNYLSGGAIINTGGTLVLTQCTLCQNRSTGSIGGGIYSSGGTLKLSHCTLFNNSSTGGGAIYNSGGILTLTNSIVSWSSPEDIYNGGSNTSFTRIGANLVNRYSNTNGVTDSGPPPITGDPELAPMGNYGGPTSTMPPLPGSPAIDQASLLSPALLTDQRGSARPLGLRPDLGAVEADIILVTTAVDELDNPGTPGTGVSLREAVRDVPAGGTVAFDRALFTGATATTNTITLTKGPLNPPRNCTLNGSANPDGMTILTQLTITQQPQSLSVAAGVAANFLVVVTNVNGGVAYQWRKGSVNNATTTAALNIAAAQESDEGVYDVNISELASPGVLTLVSVTKPAATATSQPASLIVDGALLTIKRDPSSAMLALGSSYTLRVDAIGPATPALTYQWTLNGKNISGATKASYFIPKAALTNAGTYICVVKSGTTPATSAPAEIGVVDTTPKTVNLLASPTASFTATVNAAGNGPLTFAWLKNGGGTAFNAKSFTLSKPVLITDSGLYTCTVTGAAGVFTGGAPTQLNVSNAAPQLVLPLAPPAATIGQAYFYQVPVQSIVGAPATSFSVTGALPAGITFNTTTGVLSGRPTATKTGGYALSFKAINAKSSSVAAPATLTVNVVPPNAVGVFAGPIERSPLNDNLGGRFDLTTTAAGGFSGSLTLGARAKLGFTAQLLQSAGAGDVILYGKIPGLTLSDKTPLTAYIEVFAVEQLARLTLIHPNGTTLVIPAWRNQWVVSTKPALNNPATAYAAYYTMRLDPQDLGAAPRGYGYASFTVKPDGTLTLAGKLPDGSDVTGGTFVGPDGQILLFNLLYASRGSHVGQFTLTPASPVTNNVVNGTTSWFKPAPLPTSTDTVYKAGFGPLTVTAAGGVYVPPAKGLRVMGLLTVPNPNAKLSFTLGGLAPEFTQLLNIVNPSATGLTNTNVITAPITNTTKLPTLDAAKGLFAGSFQINGATTALHRPAPFLGQIVKIGATTQGYGYFLLPTATPKISTSPKLSGRVVLGVP